MQRRSPIFQVFSNQRGRVIELKTFFLFFFIIRATFGSIHRSRYKRNNGLRGNVGAPYVVGRRGFRIPRDATKRQPPRYVQQETSNKNLIERSTNSRRNVSCKRCTLAILRSSKKYIHLDVCTRRETRLFPYFTSRRIFLNVIVEEKKNHQSISIFNEINSLSHSIYMLVRIHFRKYIFYFIYIIRMQR